VNSSRYSHSFLRPSCSPAKEAPEVELERLLFKPSPMAAEADGFAVVEDPMTECGPFRAVPDCEEPPRIRKAPPDRIVFISHSLTLRNQVHNTENNFW